MFVATKNNNKYLSRQTFCHDKLTFVATTHVFCRDKSMLVATTIFCRDKQLCCNENFVAARVLLSRQKFYVWHLPPMIHPRTPTQFRKHNTQVAKDADNTCLILIEFSVALRPQRLYGLLGAGLIFNCVSITRWSCEGIEKQFSL